ncbi:MAG: 1-acyl-sn-glycerol-3-phosphate acyltransferase [Lachnospiraceae bacterium]|nr:1-acyl-sn-glycerol-3-phosphate acyltransferase [Lachnospiraceae bacterium]
MKKQRERRRKAKRIFRMFLKVVKLIYPKNEVVGLENLPAEPCIIVANHCQIYGPVTGILYLPSNCWFWGAGELLSLKTAAKYAYKDFWSKKPRYIRWLYKQLSYIAGPLLYYIFHNVNMIGVYHDKRLMSTLKDTGKVLERGGNVVIFPECYTEHNHIVHEFQGGFVDVARLYAQKTGKEISFVPVYFAPTLKKVLIGKPTKYQADRVRTVERDRICNYLMDEITKMAEALPLHTVVPYPNISKKDYPMSRISEAANEKTSSRL